MSWKQAPVKKENSETQKQKESWIVYERETLRQKGGSAAILCCSKWKGYDLRSGFGLPEQRKTILRHYDRGFEK